MKTNQKNYLKYIVGFISCLLIRLIPFRPPNIEPILATQMPFSKAFGKFAGFSFAFISMILYDIITGHVGVWTWITALSYGLLGLWSAFYFQNKESNAWNYAKFAIMGTIAYDAVTGLTIGPLFFHQSFEVSLVGQIPFTLAHLLGNLIFAIMLSPVIYRYVILNKKFENFSIINIFNPQKA